MHEFRKRKIPVDLLLCLSSAQVLQFHVEWPSPILLQQTLSSKEIHVKESVISSFDPQVRSH